MKRVILVAILTMIFGGVYSQQKVVRGKITYKEYPVKNVIVTAKKSQASVLSNDEGKYEIVCGKNDIISFKTENFEKVRKRINEKGTVDVSLKLKKGMINEYGVILDSYLTPEQSNTDLYKSKNVDGNFSIYSNIFELIKIKFPSVKIVTSGVFGITDGGSVFLRGRTSIYNSGEAMYVVNGTVVRSINHIHPNIVKSINLLSSTEGVIRYGGDAKNGVVVIRTTIEK